MDGFRMYGAPLEVDGFSLRHGSHKGRLESHGKLLDMLNGDIRLGMLIHHEVGCCTDAEGYFSRDICVENVYAAIVMSGLVGGVENVMPSKSRWGSRAAALAMQLCGMLFHKILPRVFQKCFPKYHAVDEHAEECNRFMTTAIAAPGASCHTSTAKSAMFAL
jgi:hypothetical protein